MIDNEFYKELGERWYTSKGDALALLRQENRTKLPWVLEKIGEYHGSNSVSVLDVGCGGGFLTLALAAEGRVCTGLDVSERVLMVGRSRDPDKKVRWVEGRAEALPFKCHSFDVVCMMDVLEHISDPKQALAEAVRVLRPGGTLLFHTFNRTWLAWLFAAKGLDWFIKDSQPHVHDWNLFLKPSEIEFWLRGLGYSVREFQGIHPRVLSKAFVKLLATRRVPEDFTFDLGGGLSVGYLGCARRA